MMSLNDFNVVCPTSNRRSYMPITSEHYFFLRTVLTVEFLKKCNLIQCFQLRRVTLIRYRVRIL